MKFKAMMVFLSIFAVGVPALPAFAAQPGELTPREQGIAKIAAFTANGNLDQLKIALNDGLDAGLSVREVKEILIQMYAYCGYPRSLNGISTFMAVDEERRAAGKNDAAGRAPSEPPVSKSRYHVGMEVQTTLAGAPIPYNSGVYAFVPEMDLFLKEHLFADVIARDNLSLVEREIATVAALAAMTGTEGQLNFHTGALVRVGFTEAQTQNVVSLVRGL